MYSSRAWGSWDEEYVPVIDFCPTSIFDPSLCYKGLFFGLILCKWRDSVRLHDILIKIPTYIIIQKNLCNWELTPCTMLRLEILSSPFVMTNMHYNTYRVPQLKLDKSRSLFFRLINIFLRFKIIDNPITRF